MLECVWGEKESWIWSRNSKHDNPNCDDGINGQGCSIVDDVEDHYEDFFLCDDDHQIIKDYLICVVWFQNGIS